MNTSKLKTYAPKARRDFIAAVTHQAPRFGLTAKVGVLLLAVERGILEPQAADTTLQESVDHGFRLSERLHRSFMEHLGLPTDNKGDD